MKHLNWKLIFTLSLFGLAMGIATVFVVPSKVEPLFWLVIFIFCAVVIARRTTQLRFLHGFLVSLVNCFWITSAHVLLFQQYLAVHESERAMLAGGPMADSPRMMMLLTGPVVGVVSGLVLGLFSWIAGRFIRAPRPA